MQRRLLGRLLPCSRDQKHAQQSIQQNQKLHQRMPEPPRRSWKRRHAVLPLPVQLRNIDRTYKIEHLEYNIQNRTLKIEDPEYNIYN